MKKDLNNQNINEETILKIFKTTKNKTNFSYEELKRKINLKEKNKAQLKRILDKLIKDGTICYNTREKNYTLLENSELKKGTLNKDNSGIYYLETKNQKIRMQEEYLKGASTGDLVIVEFNRNKKNYVVKQILKSSEKSYVADIILKNGILYAKIDNNEELEVIPYPNLVVGTIALVKKFQSKAKIENIICHKDDANAEILKIAYMHNFDLSYSDKMQSELNKIPDSLDENTIQELINEKIKDLRDIPFITIDCDDTKDIDDAVAISQQDNQDIVLTIPIALVPYYITDKMSLSQRPKKTATSIYPPGCVLPMIDRKLSNGICSLNENTDRLALCIETTYDKYGNFKKIDPYIGIINSKKKAIYSKVSQALEKGIIDQEYKQFYKDLLLMQKLYLLIEKRFKNQGYLEFDVEEINLEVDNKFNLTNIVPKTRLTAEKIIEFFMLTSNSELTKYMTELGLNMIYRVDSEPDVEKLNNTISFLKDKGIIEIEKTTNFTNFDIQEILKQLQTVPSPKKEIYNRLLIRAMQKAYYSSKNIGHFPLGLDYYGQFTSPIRRGPDWRNISILLYYLKTKSVKATNKRFPLKMLEAEAKIYSERERTAIEVENECKKMIIANFIKQNIDITKNYTFHGIINEVSNRYLYITLENGIDGKLDINQLPEDEYIKETSFTLKGKNNTYNIGDNIDVQITEIDKKTNELCFRPTTKYTLSKTKKNKIRSKKI